VTPIDQIVQEKPIHENGALFLDRVGRLAVVRAIFFGRAFPAKGGTLAASCPI
jgi:hypothetical protein